MVGTILLRKVLVENIHLWEPGRCSEPGCKHLVIYKSPKFYTRARNSIRIMWNRTGPAVSLFCAKLQVRSESLSLQTELLDLPFT